MEAPFGYLGGGGVEARGDPAASDPRHYELRGSPLLFPPGGRLPRHFAGYCEVPQWRWWEHHYAAGIRFGFDIFEVLRFLSDRGNIFFLIWLLWSIRNWSLSIVNGMENARYLDCLQTFRSISLIMLNWSSEQSEKLCYNSVKGIESLEQLQTSFWTIPYMWFIFVQIIFLQNQVHFIIIDTKFHEKLAIILHLLYIYSNQWCQERIFLGDNIDQFSVLLALSVWITCSLTSYYETLTPNCHFLFSGE